MRQSSYYEVRGDGPPLLLIMGASGSGDLFRRFAELLADDDETLAAITTPIKLLVSAQSHPSFSEAAGRLAERLGVEVIRTPGNALSAS
jgi:hypothetical protein